MAEKKIGEVTHYFGHINVAALKLSGVVKIGDKIKIKGHTTDFEQEVKEMQVDHKAVDSAKKGDDVAVKINDKVREGDTIFLVK